MQRDSRPIAPARWLLRASLCLALAAWIPGAIAQNALRYAGVNLAGAEFNSAKKPGVVFKDYVYPADSAYAYVAAQGMNIVRLPFLWERLQPVANGELDAAQLGYLRTAVERARNHGLRLILDPHNYAKYYGVRIGGDQVPASALADLWRRLSIEFGNDDTVIFGLMNEPNGVASGDWAATAQLAIDAIRGTGAYNLILVPGTAFTGAHSWYSGWYGVSNAQAMVSIEDPAENLAFEVHQYLDADSSGTSAACVSATVGSERLQGFTLWLRANGYRGFLGEFGASSDATCMAALDGMLGYMHDNADVWMGWTAWSAGAWWKTDYVFSLQPGKDGADKPQMGVLAARAKQVTQ
ncbi:glycoside hydrolase family 5 protein [Xanthomonas sp. AM6]|uniref:glycoside hydrolase family 5 protein n=1 Tax=Xanthomonas sp. AM6 TaxID=2982531 RepID=UPI0021D9C151|nr:glycoside hydrolase family 5 protein [Xanthomonas sp. AM6]UYB52546.1 glycoside hydrolase family 5 protein [Xanthomonas sp. AM6]